MYGVTGPEAAEATELPRAFIAFTVKVTAVPLVRLLTIAVSTLPTVTGLPTDGVTMYPVIAEPPSLLGVNQETVADALLGTAETYIGSRGTAHITIACDSEEAAELPAAFIAFTVNV